MEHDSQNQGIALCVPSQTQFSQVGGKAMTTRGASYADPGTWKSMAKSLWERMQPRGFYFRQRQVVFCRHYRKRTIYYNPCFDRFWLLSVKQSEKLKSHQSFKHPMVYQHVLRSLQHPAQVCLAGSTKLSDAVAWPALESGAALTIGS